MKRSLKMWGLIVVMGLAAVAGAEAPLAERLPERTLVYIGSAGRTPLMEASRAGQFIASDDFQRTISQFKEGILASVPDIQQIRQGMSGMLDLLELGLQGRACLALVDLPTKDREMPGIALIVEVGDNAQAFEKKFTEMMGAVPPGEIQNITIGQDRLKQLQNPHGSERIVFGISRKTFYWIFGTKLPEEILAGKGTSLAASAKFKKHFEAVDGKNVQLAAYVQVPELVDAIMATIAKMSGRYYDGDDLEGFMREMKQRAERQEQQVHQVLAGLGLDRAEALVGAVRVADDGLMQSKYKLFTPAPHNGLLMVASGKPLSEAQLGQIPADAIYASVVNVPARRILLESARIFRSMPNGAPSLDKMVGQIQADTGINLLTDVYDQLGDVSTIRFTRSTGGVLAGPVVSFEIKDTQAFDNKVLARIRKMVADIPQPAGQHPWEMPDPIPSIRKIHVGDQAIEYVSVPIRRDPFPVAPAWMLRDGKLHVAAWPQPLQQLAARSGQVERLIDRPAFGKQLARLGSNPSAVFYCDSPELMRQLYPLALAGWTTLANMLNAEADVAFMPSMLPPLSKINQMLTPGLTTLRGEQDGVVIEQIGALPTFMLPAVPVFVPLGTGAALPLVNMAQINARKALELTHVRSLTMACHRYAIERSNKLPEKIEQLLEREHVTARALRSPFNKTPAPKYEEGKLVGESDYLLAQAGKALHEIDNASRTPIIVPNPKTYDPARGAAIGYADGSARWYTGPLKDLGEAESEDAAEAPAKILIVPEGRGFRAVPQGR
ncbi:MAG: hypothetical protein ACOCZE_07360 [Planctomycetota bacterium]